MSTNIERIEELFTRAIEFGPEERAAFLAGACGHDNALLSRIRALLQAHEAAEGLLPEQPRSELTLGQIVEKPGDRIGRYKLLEQIGEGGCGVVYMADQEEPVRRRVALKVIKLGMDTKKVVARFEAERQALALMDHPNIAKVLDGGATSTGRPYFVMELVRGVKVTDYCDQNDLSTAQRLELFIQACRAIQHAHQKSIIHRDIKPSNVLVSVHDGMPVAKVIDFGIAKATEGRLTDQTLFTSFEQFIGTPAYMSPEQAELKGLDVDTRTDIYSLGVLLYELLTGATPFDAKELISAGLDEMRRTIREKEPLRPSTRLTLELAKAELEKRPRRTSNPQPIIEKQDCERAEVSAGRLLRKKELVNVLKGDLDWIVMKCLEKDRTRRYETANGLAVDLQRHLQNEPVVARPPSSLYRFQKLVRRNRLVFAAAGAVALALVVGTLGSTWEAIRARHAERAQGRLRDEADKARAGEAKQRAAAEVHLYEALLDEARARQLTGRAGQRFESLDAISKAAAIRSSVELSDAAVAAFALTDLRDAKQWHFASHWLAEGMCFDNPFALYTCRSPSGISVRRMRDDQQLAFLPIRDVSDPAYDLQVRRFDPNSRYVAASCLSSGTGPRCRVWDLTREGALVLDLPSPATSEGGLSSPDFSPDGQTIALLNPDRTVSIREIASGKDLKRLSVEGQPGFLRFNPDGTKLAGLEIGRRKVRIFDLASGRLITTLVSSNPLTSFSWNHDGSLLATGSLDGLIELWNARSGRVQGRLEGHESRVTVLAFSHQGDLLASGSWDGTLRLWDVARAQQLVVYRTEDTDLHFSADDRTLAYAIAGQTSKLLEVAHSTGYRRLTGEEELSKSWCVDFSSDGRLMATSTLTGIGLWDAIAKREIGFIQTAEGRSLLFQTNGGFSMVAATLGGLFRWPIRMESVGSGWFLRVDPPKIVLPGEGFRYLALDSGGGRILASRPDGTEPLIVEEANPTNVMRLEGHPGANSVAWSPGGNWVATGTWKGTGVNVYEPATGKIIRKLPVQGSASIAFSPNDQWLATANMMGFRLWKTGSWELWPQAVASDQVSEVNPMAFSPDGRLLAAVHAMHELQIVRVPDCEVVATLTIPTFDTISWMRFSPDGTKLAVLEWSGQIDLWDLRLLRDELKKLHLDWKLPPFPTESDAPPAGPAEIQLDAGPFSKEDLARTIPARSAQASSNLIDLTDYYNAPLTESWHSRKEARNDLSELPRGIQKIGGVEFDIRGLIQIGAGAANGLFYPNHVHDISIHRQCQRLHFLHAAIFAAAAKPGDELGSYIFHYTDGRQVELPIITGKDLGEWWSQPNEQDMNTFIAWSGSNPSAQRAGHSIRLFSSVWENPFPDVPIQQFDFVSDKPTPGQPFLVAITAEP